MHDFSLKHLSDAALLEGLAGLASDDRITNARLLAHIAEVQRRRLYLEHGCSSMYRYCVDRLHMSADVAYKRVRAARAVRRCPAILAAIADGRLHLSGVALLATHLTRENAHELVAAAEGKSRREIERLLAERFPRTPALLMSGAGANPALTPAPGTGDGAPTNAGALAVPAPGDVMAVSQEQAPGPVRAAGVPATRCAATGSPRARISPVGPGVSELVALLGDEACAQLEASRELLAHAVPSGDLAEVLERAIALQYAQLRKRRCGATDRPRTSGDAEGTAPRVGANPRHIPNAVLRAVWERDGGRCTFTGADGHRCEERSRLEVDHVVPVARGGRSTVENLRLLCRAHNQHAAERTLGREKVSARREAAQRRRAAERFYKQAEHERTEKRKAEIARQREELGEAFRMLGYRGRDLELALAYCASRAEAPPEERLKYALGCLAPRVRKESPTASEQAAQASNEAA